MTNAMTKNGCETSACETNGVASLSPRCDIVEREGTIELVVDVPGASQESVAVTVEDQVLSIEAPIVSHAAEGWRVLGGGLPQGAWKRSFRLGQDVDAGSIRAHVKDGVLTVRIEKRRPAKTTIPVHAG